MYVLWFEENISAYKTWNIKFFSYLKFLIFWSDILSLALIYYYKTQILMYKPNKNNIEVIQIQILRLLKIVIRKEFILRNSPKAVNIND